MAYGSTVALYVLCVLLGLTRLSSAQATCPACPNVGGIVAASVFGTLGVILIIGAVIIVILWRRRRVGYKPARPAKKLQDETDGTAEGSAAYVNPAFQEGEGPMTAERAAEEGFAGYVECRDDHSPDKKKSPRSSIANLPPQKTWNSLPRADIPGSGINRHGSFGSLDHNYMSQDPEVTNVWLQSQDFIGLGFNISGSMRDGIFVSQVHNRGPAIESGNIKVGDRILSVTISFESIVYEDALTVLSYASPYPVKVSLQKEKSYHGNSSDEKATNLSHPLYRSQSLDALVRIGKEKFLKPKRSYSEIKPDGKKQVSKVELNEPNSHEALAELFENGESTHTQLSVNDKISDNDQSIIIHRVEDTFQAERETTLNSALIDDSQMRVPGSMDTVDLSTPEVEESQFAAIFDKFSAPNTINFDDSNVDFSNVESDSKPPEEQSNEVEDAIQMVTVSSTLESTPTMDYHNQDVIEEDVIVPKSQERQISIGNENIEFSLIAPDEPGNNAPIEIEEIPEETLRPDSPSSDSSSDREAVNEDVISPTRAKREAQEPKAKGQNKTTSVKGNEKDDSNKEMDSSYVGINDYEADIVQTRDAKINVMHKNNDMFKTRDDLSTDMPFLDPDSGTVARAVSYDTELPNLVEQKEHLAPTRADSLKEDKKSNKQSKERPLEWSGKRLIRSGSFSEIPQDGTTDGDWASSPDNRTITSNDDYYTESDSDSTRDASNLARTDKFQHREDLANFSDLTDSNSSRGSSPDPKTNGQDDGIGTSPELSPSKSPKENSIEFDVKHNNELNSNKLTDNVNKPTTISTKYEGFGAYTVVVGQDEDTSDA